MRIYEQGMNYIAQRASYYRFLEGVGIDVGPFDKPFIKDPAKINIEVKYVDHLTCEELKKMFPEIENLNPVPLDYICDISKEGFIFAQDESYDFIILSHIVEHVANPFFLIKESYRILKEGGVLYISTPDCRFSNDVGRLKTTFKELENLFKDDIREISDDYVLAYLKSPVISKIPWVNEILNNPLLITKEVYDNERKRSFHVHVWDCLTFFRHILLFFEKYQLKFSLLDLALYKNNSYENIMVLRKSQRYETERLEKDIKNLYLLRNGNELPEIDIEEESQKCGK